MDWLIETLRKKRKKYQEIDNNDENTTPCDSARSTFHISITITRFIHHWCWYWYWLIDLIPCLHLLYVSIQLSKRLFGFEWIYCDSLFLLVLFYATTTFTGSQGRAPPAERRQAPSSDRPVSRDTGGTGSRSRPWPWYLYELPVRLSRCCHSRLERTFEDPDRSGKVVHPASSAQGSGENLNRGHEIVGEGIVQVALWAWLVRYCCQLLAVLGSCTANPVTVPDT